MADKLTTADRRFSVLALANLFTPDAKLTPCMGALWISQTQRMLAMSKFETQLLKGKGQQRRLTLRNSGMSETSGRSVRIVCWRQYKCGRSQNKEKSAWARMLRGRMIVDYKTLTKIQVDQQTRSLRQAGPIAEL